MTDNKRDHATEVSELLSVESMLKYLSGIFTSTVNSEVDRTRGAFLVDLSRAILAFCRFQDLQRSEGSVLHIGLEIDVSGALIRSLYSDSGQDDLAMLCVGAFEAVELPPLALITAEVVHIEIAVRFTGFMQLTLNLDHAFAGGVNGETPQVAHDPTPS